MLQPFAGKFLYLTYSFMNVHTLSTHLSKGYDELTEVFLAAGEADVVVGDKQLANNVHLGEGCPQGAVCVAVQTLVLCQAEQRPVALILGPRIQVPGIKNYR